MKAPAVDSVSCEPSWATLRAQLSALYVDVIWLAQADAPITREQLARLEELVREIREAMQR